MMNFFKLDVKTIALIILAGIVIYNFWYGESGDKQGEIIKVDGKKYEVIKRTVDTIVKTRTQTKYVKGDDIYHETVVEKEKRVEVPVLTKVDTLTILKDFYKKVIYKDTIKLDGDMGMIALTDTISKNKLLGRKWIAYLKERTIKETTIVKELPKNQVYWGFNGGFNKEDVVNNVSAGLILKTKSDKLLQLNLGVSNNQTPTGNKISPYVGVGMYWKIRIKK
jgi:hypothetical protein